MKLSGGALGRVGLRPAAKQVHFRCCGVATGRRRSAPEYGRFPVGLNLSQRDPSCCEGHEATRPRWPCHF
jgi:hypothetical protein